MADLYVKLSDLNDICRIHGISYHNALDGIKPVTSEDIVEEMPISDVRSILEKRQQVFATQTWTKADAIAALRSAGIHNPDDRLVMEVMDEARNLIEDCSDNWEHLHSAARSVLIKMEE